MKAHPLADMFPMMSKSEIKKLADDIAAKGQMQTILTYEGKILDGRNRFAACKLAGVEPRFEDIESSKDFKGDIHSIVKSLNIERRHLTTSQRSMIAAKIAKSAASTGTDEAGSQKEAAKAMKVSRSSVQRAAKVEKKATKKVKEAVSKGELSLGSAAAISSLSKKEQAKVIKKGAKAAVATASKLRGVPRGGLFASMQEDKNKEQSRVQAGTLLDRLDAWWEEHKIELSTEPVALPEIVFKKIRTFIARD